MENSSQEYNWYKIFAAEGMGLNFVKEGVIRTVIVKDQRLCFRRKGDNIHAFQPKCPHNGGPLQNGTFNENGDIVCPWHRYAFCVETGKNTSGEGYYLENYPVEIRGNDAWIGYPKPPKAEKGWWGRLWS